jgi:hypothetical protein
MAARQRTNFGERFCHSGCIRNGIGTESFKPALLVRPRIDMIHGRTVGLIS